MVLFLVLIRLAMTVADLGPKEPLISREGRVASISVPVYSPGGGKEVVQTEGDQSGCLSCFCHGPVQSEVALTLQMAVWFSVGLFAAKLYCFLSSGSLAMLASLVDSTVDLIGQGTLMWTNHLANSRKHDEYPVGRGRLEPLGVMICAVVMGMASMQVISTSAGRLVTYWGRDDSPTIEFTRALVPLLVSIIIFQACLYLWCKKVATKYSNDSVKAVAQDNANDVLSNTIALLAPQLTRLGKGWWIADPIAGIVISVYIIFRWVQTGMEQAEMIVGKRADAEFLRKLHETAAKHSTDMQLDQLTAYHFGPKYLVEIEMVMSQSTSLRESHDAGITLQHEIETFDEVERCFVHIDYQLRLHDDHDTDVPIDEKIYGGPCRGSPRASDVILMKLDP